MADESVSDQTDGGKKGWGRLTILESNSSFRCETNGILTTGSDNGILTSFVIVTAARFDLDEEVDGVASFNGVGTFFSTLTEE
jgi:hypothetical protein